MPDAPLEIQGQLGFAEVTPLRFTPTSHSSTTVVTSTRHSARGLLSKVLHDDPGTGRADDGTNFFARVSTASSNHSQGDSSASLRIPTLLGLSRAERPDE